MNARQKRYQILKDLLKDGDLVYTAHHIDDSFEWSLMQQFKSSSLRSTIGIPVINGVVVRPLMCFTKKQIAFYAKSFKVPFFNDSSNQLAHFERNYVRLKIIPAIKNKYPAYLKHYVTRSLMLASKFNLLRDCPKDGSYKVFKDQMNGSALVDLNNSGFAGANELIEKLLKESSHKERGSLQKELQKLIQAIQNGKKGPMSFPGGVKVFIEKGWLYFINQNYLSRIHEIDMAIKDKLGNLQNQGLVNELHSASLTYDFIYLKQISLSRKAGARSIHPLLPLTTQYLLDNRIFFKFVF